MDFFDLTVTHVISDAELPRQSENHVNKENNHFGKPLSKRDVADGKSPNKLTNRYCNVNDGGSMLMLDAQH